MRETPYLLALRSGGSRWKLARICKPLLFLATCQYGIPFMILGNTAGNAVFFTEKAIGASQRDPNNAEVRDISNAPPAPPLI